MVEPAQDRRASSARFRRGGLWVELLLVLVLLSVALPVAWLRWRGSAQHSDELATELVEASVVEPEPAPEPPAFRIPEHQPDEAAAEDFGRRWASRMRAGETAFLRDVFDAEAFMRRVYQLAELDAVSHEQRLNALRPRARFRHHVLSGNEQIDKLLFVGVVDRDERRWVLFRRPGQDSLGNYFELELILNDEGEPRVADLTLYPGGRLSKMVRNEEFTRYDTTRLFGLVATKKEPLIAGDSHVFTRFFNCDQVGDYAGMIQIYEEFAEVFNEVPYALCRAIHALVMAGQSERAYEISQLMQERHPHDPHVDLLMWQEHFAAQRFDELLASQDRLEAYFGSDAGLDLSRALIYLQQGQARLAESSLRAAIEKQPDLELAYLRLIDLLAEQQDFDQLAEMCHALGLRTGRWLYYPQLHPGLYQFAKSPQYEAWIERLKREKIVPEDWQRDPWEALGRRLERALNQGDVDVLAEIFDPVELARRTFVGLDQFQNKHLDELRSEIGNPDTIRQAASEMLMTVVGIGGHVRFVRVREVFGTPRLFFCILLEGGQPIYVDFETRFDGQQALKVADFWFMVLDTSFCELIRLEMLTKLAAVVDWHSLPLWIEERDTLKSQEQLLHIRQLIAEEQHVEAWELLRQLPLTIRNRQMNLKHRIELAKLLGGAYLQEMVLDVQRFVANDETRQLWLADLCLAQEDWPRACEAYHALDRMVGGDVYLITMQGVTYCRMGEYGEAERCLREAIRQNPSYPPAYDHLLDVMLERRDHVETRRLLDQITHNFGMQFDDLKNHSKFSEFVRSSEYRKWRASQ